VRVFLKRNPFLFDLLERTRPESARIFGDHALHVFLETHYDVEERDESLMIKIQVDLGLDDAEEYLNRFDEEWWLKIDRRYFGIVEADIEFGPRVRA